MFVIDFIVETVVFLWKNRNNPLTMAVLLPFAAYLVDKFGRKLITNQIKRLFHVREKSEFATYTKNQARIESKVDLLLQERGLVWVAQSEHTSQLPKNTSLKKMSLLSWLAVLSPVRTIGAFTMLTDRFNHSKTRGESIPMKKKLLSRKFLMAVISAALVIANDGLNLGLDQGTIVAFGSIVVAWIIGEAAVDVSGKEKKVEVANASYTSREDSEGA